MKGFATQLIRAFSRDNSNGKSYITVIKKGIGFDNSSNIFNLRKNCKMLNVKFSDISDPLFPMRYQEFYYGRYTDYQRPLKRRSESIIPFSQGPIKGVNFVMNDNEKMFQSSSMFQYYHITI